MRGVSSPPEVDGESFFENLVKSYRAAGSLLTNGRKSRMLNPDRSRHVPFSFTMKS